MSVKQKRIPFAHIGRAAGDLFRFAPWEMVYRIGYAIIKAVLGIAVVLWTAELFDEAALSPDISDRLIVLGVGLCICIGFPMLADALRWSIENINLFTKTRNGFINKLFEHNIRVPLVQFENPETFNHRYRAKLAIYNNHIINLFLYAFDTLPQALTIIGVTGALYNFSPALVPLALLSVLPTFFLSFLQNKRLHALHTSQIPAARKRDYLWDLQMKKESVREMRALHFEKYLKGQWNDINRSIIDERYHFEQRLRVQLFLCQLPQTICYAVCIGFSVMLMLDGKISVGAFGACIATFGRLQSLAGSIVHMLSRVAETSDYVDDYYQYFNISLEQPGNMRIDGFSNRLEAQNLYFTYPSSEKPAIDGLNLSIKKGERIVIVGENGSGKTTLSKLLTGVYAPDTGDVLFDGQNIRDANKELLYKRISMIGQNFVRYNLTLRENIAMSDISRLKDDNALNQSLRNSEIDHMASVIGGLDAMLGREYGGIELSGGEWQKIAIARGLFKESDFIIVDEPTSALDPLVEFDILSRFLELTEGKTALIISHRVGLCRFADRIVVVKEGRVVEDGRHTDLIRQGGEYARIWHEQAKWYAV